MSSDWKSRLTAASGFLELGMLDDAALELEEIPPEHKTTPEVMAFRVALYEKAQRWDGMAAVARFMVKARPNEVEWRIAWAESELRQKHGMHAEQILLDALIRHEDSADLWLALARVVCVDGRIDEAKSLVGEAINRDATKKLEALDHPDLRPIWDALATL